MKRLALTRMAELLLLSMCNSLRLAAAFIVTQ